MDRLLELVAGTAFDVLQLAPGILDARFYFLTADGLEVGGGAVNLPLRGLGRTFGNVATITLRLDCPGGGFVNGRPVESGSVIVWRPGAAYDGIAPAGDAWVTLLVPWEELPRRPGVARRGPSWRWRTSMLVTRLEPDESTAARAWVAEIHRLATGRRVPVRRDVAGDLRDRWLGLARTLYARAQPSPTPRGAAWSATLAVRAADRYLHEHLGSTVYLADVSRATDVPARTLQAAFRDVLDGSPMAYLETLRLHAALRALRTGAADTVRAAALGVGLRHAARFSAAFRARFSAKPGDVLRAAKAARGAKPDPA